MGHLTIRVPLPVKQGGPHSGRRRPDHNDLREQLDHATVERQFAEDRQANWDRYYAAVQTWEDRLEEAAALLVMDGMPEKEAGEEALMELLSKLPRVEQYGAY